MKRIATILAAAILAGCQSRPCVPHTAEGTRDARPAPLGNVSSWALYYGPATPDAVGRLSGYSLVVIDPAALGDAAKETIAALKANGCKVAGYLSFIEVATWHRYRSRIPREWYILRDDGSPWVPWAGTGVGWNANLAASLAEPGWREMLCDLVQSEVLDYGCDGVFMDTLEDVDFHSMPAKERDPQVEGLRALMALLDERFPDAFFIGNRTLERAFDAVADHIDAVCWESFAPVYFADPNSRPWMDGIAERFAAAQKKHPFLVVSLWDSKKTDTLAADQAKMRELSAERGYIPYCTVGGYGNLPEPEK